MITASLPPFDDARPLREWYPDGEAPFRRDLIHAQTYAVHENREFLAGLERAWLKSGMDHRLPKAGYDRLQALVAAYHLALEEENEE